MKPDDQAHLLSAYLDGELDAEQIDHVEALLRDDASLGEDLDAMRETGRALRSGLMAAAQRQDYSAMEAAVLDAVLAGHTGTITRQVDMPGSAWEGLVEMVGGLFRRPAFAFAFGALIVAGAWSLTRGLVPAAPTAPGAATVAGAEGEPGLRAPEGMVTFAKTPLLLENLDVRKGRVVLDTRPEDPEAPAVLWHFSDSADAPAARRDASSSPEPEEDPRDERAPEQGDPL